MNLIVQIPDSWRHIRGKVNTTKKFSDITCYMPPTVIVHYILRERNGVKMSAGSGKMIGQSVSERDHAAPALLLLSCAISFLRFSKRKKFDGKLRMRAKRCTRWL